jgi:hypothetical protein
MIVVQRLMSTVVVHLMMVRYIVVVQVNTRDIVDIVVGVVGVVIVVVIAVFVSAVQQFAALVVDFFALVPPKKQTESRMLVEKLNDQYQPPVREVLMVQLLAPLAGEQQVRQQVQDLVRAQHCKSDNETVVHTMVPAFWSHSFRSSLSVIQAAAVQQLEQGIEK